MKKLLLLLTLSFLSTQSFAGSCPDGSEQIKSVSADGSYYVYNCGNSSNEQTSSSVDTEEKIEKELAEFEAELEAELAGEIGSLEVEWTDFSPQPTAVFIEEEITTIDKEKYREYFEDRELVMMVLGGIEWWTLNCGKLTGTGNYFMNLGIEKHNITKEEMQESMIFQTGHFAAALYNNCDVFLEHTKSIGLHIMLEKTIKLDRYVI